MGLRLRLINPLVACTAAHTRTHTIADLSFMCTCCTTALTLQTLPRVFHLNSIAFIMKTGEHHVHIDAILYSDYKVTATGYDECRINNPKLFLHISLGTAEKIIPMYTLQSGSMFIFC